MNEKKNIVINNYVRSLVTLISNLDAVLSGLGTETETNTGIIKTTDILMNAINSQLIILQSELDTYGG